jgi:hypothetical protein
MMKHNLKMMTLLWEDLTNQVWNWWWLTRNEMVKYVWQTLMQCPNFAMKNIILCVRKYKIFLWKVHENYFERFYALEHDISCEKIIRWNISAF